MNRHPIDIQHQDEPTTPTLCVRIIEKMMLRLLRLLLVNHVLCGTGGVHGNTINPIVESNDQSNVEAEMGFGPALRSNTGRRSTIEEPTLANPAPSPSSPPPPPPSSPPTTDTTATPPVDTATNTASLPTNFDAPSPQPLPPPAINKDDIELLSKIEETTKVLLNTTKGAITMDVHEKWAPLGASTFLSLVMSNFYDDCYFFRTVPGFVSQFGINADPRIQKQYDISIQDDTPETGATFHSNSIGTVSFASHGENSRSTQIFINLRDNTQLDAMHFTPFAKLTEESLQVAVQLYSDYGEAPDQGKLTASGNTYLEQEFPSLDKIYSATIKE